MNLAYNPFEKSLSKKIAQIMVNDMKIATDYIESNGFILYLALFIHFPITLIKIASCTYNHYNTPDILSKKYLKDSLQNIHRKRFDYAQERTVIENIKTLEDEGITFTNSYTDTKREKERIEALSYLRNHLIANKGILKAKLIKKVRHNLSEKDLDYYLTSGELNRASWTEYVTFSEGINRCLFEIFPDQIRLKTIKGLSYPCIAFPNGDTFELVNDLRNTFLNENIKIVFDLQNQKG